MSNQPQSPATVADAERAAFEKFWAAEKALNGGVAIGADYRHWAMKGYVAGCAAAPVGPDVAADPRITAFYKLRDIAERDADVESASVIQEAIAMRCAAGAPAETVRLISSEANWSDEQIINVLHSCGVDTYPSKHGFSATQISATSIPTLRAVLEILAGSKPATFQRGTIVRKKSGSQWEGTIVGTYSSSITPEGYAVESSTHRGSVQIYPVSALELVTKGNV